MCALIFGGSGALLALGAPGFGGPWGPLLRIILINRDNSNRTAEFIMALLEVVQRKIHKYGLVPKLIRALPLILIACAVFGALWVLYLPIEGQYRHTYILENALMPSQAYLYYRESEWNFLRGYRDEISQMTNSLDLERSLVFGQYLEDIGYLVALHHSNRGDTVYGVLTAPRGDGTEAMVLVAPWKLADRTLNVNGVLLAMGLAKYFARWTVWSKNIIVVFPSNGQEALRLWVKAYHTGMDLTAGLLEAAIVVEYPGDADYYDYLEIAYEGVNGQLPNLDLLNTVVSIAEHEGMQVLLQHVPKDRIAEKSYSLRLSVLLRGIGALVFAGLKSSNGCDVFSGYRIQALTLRAIGDSGTIDITTLGRVVEAGFRSVNNLLEKFHQSFFFYLMLAPRQFISIGTYLPLAVLLSAAFALASLSQVLNSRLPVSTLVSTSAKGLLAFLGLLVATCVVGGLLILLTEKWAALVYYLFFIGSVLLLLMPTKQVMLAFVAGRIGRANPFNPAIFYALTAYTLHALLLLYLSLIITLILVVHFSLAYAMSIAMLPLTFVRPITLRSSKYQEHINLLSLLASSPWLIAFLVGLLSQDFSEGPISVMAGLLSCWSQYDCWTYFIIILGWMPVWLGSAVIGSVIIDESEYGVVDLKKDI